MLRLNKIWKLQPNFFLSLSFSLYFFFLFTTPNNIDTQLNIFFSESRVARDDDDDDEREKEKGE